MERSTTKLAQIITSGKLTLAPGAYDALSARLIEDAGFEVISATGAGISATLGYPDIGLVTMTEVVARVKSMADVVSLPILADADTGYGNAINVIRTVREFERAGAAGVHLEDQITPKKCGQLSGKQLILAEEMEKKIEAARQAREDPDFVIIARTDARAELGVEEAIRRANLYATAGADAIFIYGPQSSDELSLIASKVRAPLVGHISPGARLEGVSDKTFEALGYRLLLFPLQMLLVAINTQRNFLKALRKDPSDQTFRNQMENPLLLYEMVGLSDFRDLERQFSLSSNAP